MCYRQKTPAALGFCDRLLGEALIFYTGLPLQDQRHLPIKTKKPGTGPGFSEAQNADSDKEVGIFHSQRNTTKVARKAGRIIGNMCPRGVNIAKTLLNFTVGEH